MDRSIYEEQDGCHNCGYVFIKREYEDEREYYCTFGAPDRPLCGSLVMGEGCGGYQCNDREYLDRMNAWFEWTQGRGVHPWGKCSYWDDSLR